jgi:hypothetical protein
MVNDQGEVIVMAALWLRCHALMQGRVQWVTEQGNAIFGQPPFFVEDLGLSFHPPLPQPIPLPFIHLPGEGEVVHAVVNWDHNWRLHMVAPHYYFQYVHRKTGVTRRSRRITLNTQAQGSVRMEMD